MSNSNDILRLRRMLSMPGGCGVLPLSDDQLGELLDSCGCFELAAYKACVRLASDDSIKLPDGTQTVSQSKYWLRMARTFRPNTGGCAKRADEMGGEESAL